MKILKADPNQTIKAHCDYFDKCCTSSVRVLSIGFVSNVINSSKVWMVHMELHTPAYARHTKTHQAFGFSFDREDASRATRYATQVVSDFGFYEHE